MCYYNEQEPLCQHYYRMKQRQGWSLTPAHHRSGQPDLLRVAPVGGDPGDTITDGEARHTRPEREQGVATTVLDDVLDPDRDQQGQLAVADPARSP
jgi:hypothetical protein